MNTTAQAMVATDFEAIKIKQQTTWGSGDYGRIGVTLQISGEQLCESMDLRAGQTVLDVAGGNGNVSLAAARRHCEVLCTDYVEALLQQAQRRADAECLPMGTQIADAEALPFENCSFDNVVSTYGVMFAPNQAQAAAELMRVCRDGGKIGLANWTPDGFIGQLLKTVSGHVPPPQGVSSPSLWGTEAFINDHFAEASDVVINRRDFVFRYASPRQWLDVFRTYYGPTHKAFLALGEAGGRKLEADIYALIANFNQATDGTMVVPSRYLEVVVRK